MYSEKFFPLKKQIKFCNVRSILMEGLQDKKEILYELGEYCFLPYTKVMKGSNKHPRTLRVLPYVFLDSGIRISLCTEQEYHNSRIINPDMIIVGYLVRYPHEWAVYVEQHLMKNILP